MARIKPSKPAAVFSAVIGVGIGIVGGVAFFSGDSEANPAFIALWLVALVGIIGFNLWSAFAKNGATQIIE